MPRRPLDAGNLPMHQHRSPVTQGGSHLNAALGVTKRRLVSVWVRTALGVWLAGSLAALAAFVVLDHWLDGGVPVAAGAVARWLYLVGSAGWLVTAVVVPLARRVHDLYAARVIERSHPEFRNSLVDAVLLARHAELPGSVRTAIVDQASGEVDQVDPQKSVSTRRVRQVLVANAAVFAVFVAYSLLAPKSVWPSLARALGMRLPAPSWTLIADVAPPDGTSVLRGDPVRFTARLGGRVPESATVRFSADGGVTWIGGHQLTMQSPPTARKDGTWQAVKAGQDVQRSMVWQIVAGDASSELRRLEVRDLPEIASISQRLEYPAYTRLPPATQPGGDIDALVGTRVTLRAMARVAARDPVLITGLPPDEKRRVLAQPSPAAPHEMVADLTVTADDTYQILFRDTHGQTGRDAIRHTIRARPDEPPTVRVQEPGPQVRAAADDKLPLLLGLEDDYGLSRLLLSLRKPGQKDVREIPLSIDLPAGQTQGQVQGQIDLALAAARPGDVLEWWVSVWDNREDARGKAAHQKSDSDVRRIIIPAPEALAANPAAGRADATTQPASRPAGDRPAEATASSAPAGESDRVADAGESKPGDEQASMGEGDKALDEFARRHQRELDALEKHLADAAPRQETNLEPQSTTQPSRRDAGPNEPAPQTQPADDAAPPITQASGAPKAGDASAQPPDAQQRGQTAQRASAGGDQSPQEAGPQQAQAGEAGAASAPPNPGGQDSDQMGAQSGDRAGANASDQGEAGEGDPSSGAAAGGESGGQQSGPGDSAAADNPGQEGGGSGNEPGGSDGQTEGNDAAQPGGQNQGDSGQAGRERATGGDQSDSGQAGESGASDSSPSQQGNAGQGGQGGPPSEGGDAPSAAPNGQPGQGSAEQSSGQAPSEDETGQSGTGDSASNAGESGDSTAQGQQGDSGRSSETEGGAGSSEQGSGPPSGSSGGTAEGSSGEGHSAGQSSSGQPGSNPGSQGSPGEGASGSGSTQGGQGDGSSGPDASSQAPGSSNAPSASPGAGQGGGSTSGQGSARGGTAPPGTTGGGESSDPGSSNGSSGQSGSGGQPASGQGGQSGSGSSSDAGQPAQGGGGGGPQANQPGGSGTEPGSQSSLEGGGGGRPGVGTMSRVPDKAADPDRPIEAPNAGRPGGPPPRSVGRLERLMDALDRELRRGEPREELLADLGWTLPEAQQFVEAYRRLKTGGQRQTGQTPLPAGSEVNTETPRQPAGVLRGGQGTARDARSLEATHQRPTDRTRELMEVGRQRVTPRHRPILEAYYRSLATQPAG